MENLLKNVSLIRRIATNVIKIYDSDRGLRDTRRCAKYRPAYLRGLLAKVFLK